MIKYIMSNTIDPIMSALANPILAASASFASTIGLATNALPVPDGVPAWLPYAISVLGPILMAFGIRVLRAISARKRALAEAKDARAATLRKDGDPANDAEAVALEDEAAALRAEAAALEAIQVPR